MRYIGYGRDKMMIGESTAKKQERINSGRDVVVSVNKYRIDEEDRDDGDRNNLGEDTTEFLRIDESDVRESQIRRLGKLRAYMDKDKVREALNCLEISVSLFEDDYKDDNGMNNSNNGKNGNRDVGVRRRE